MKIWDKPLKRIFLAAAVIVILVFLHFVGVLKPLERGVRTVFTPIQKGTQKVAGQTAGFFHFLSSINDLEEENKRLKEDQEKLLVENTKLQEVKQENEALRAQLGFSETTDFKLEPATVIGFDPSHLNQVITIDKGSKQGLVEDMPVISTSGLLLGRVQQVDNSRSTVLLAIDKNSHINALLQDSRATGVVKGDLGLGFRMELIPQNVVVTRGEVVVTSGLGGEFPKGLIIGEVEDAYESDNALFQEAYLRPLYNYRNLEFVFVVTNY